MTVAVDKLERTEQHVDYITAVQPIQSTSTSFEAKSPSSESASECDSDSESSTRRLTERANERLGKFANSLALTTGQQTVFSLAVSKVAQLVQGAFPRNSPAIRVFGSLGSGLATATSDINIHLTISGKATTSKTQARQDFTCLQLYIKASGDPAIEACDPFFKKARPYLKLRVYGITVQLAVNSGDNIEVSDAIKKTLASAPLVKPLVHVVYHAVSAHQINLPNHVVAGLALFFFETHPTLQRGEPISARILQIFLQFISQFNFAENMIVTHAAGQVFLRTDGSSTPVHIAMGDPQSVNIARYVGEGDWGKFVVLAREWHEGLEDARTMQSTLNQICVVSQEFLLAQANLTKIEKQEKEQKRAEAQQLLVKTECESPRRPLQKRTAAAADIDDDDGRPAKRAHLELEVAEDEGDNNVSLSAATASVA